MVDLHVATLTTSGQSLNAYAYTLQKARPIADISTGTWTPSSGSDLYAMLDEETPSDLDYIRSSNDPNEDTCEVKLGPLIDPGVSYGHSLLYRIDRTGTVGENLVFDLLEGSTELDSWFVSVPTGTVTWERSLSANVIDNINDYTNLRVRMTATAGTYYYVDATLGDDDNPGTMDLPWQTITKVNAVTFVAGDHILFKRGETFVGILWPENYGTDTAPITFGAYGTGNRPIISNGGTYNLACTIQVSYNAYHLRFEYLDFSGCNADGSTVVDCHSHDVYFYDCIFRDGVEGSGLTAYDTSSDWGYNVTADTCQAYDNDHSGFSFASYSGMNYIKNCIAHDNGHHAWADHGIYSRHGIIIEDCLCYNNTVGAGIKVNCQGVYTSAEFPTVRNNVCYSNYIGIQIDNINAIVYNNKCYTNAIGALCFSSDAEGSLIYYNTFINSTTAGEYLIRAEGDISGVTIKNNLFIQDAAVADRLILGLTGATGGCSYLAANNDWDYNIYYHNASPTAALFTDSLYTWSQWTGWGAEPNGTRILEVPDFVTPYTDLHPTDGGNLKALGVAITGYEIDLDGNARADPPTPGCYEEESA